MKLVIQMVVEFSVALVLPDLALLVNCMLVTIMLPTIIVFQKY